MMWSGYHTFFLQTWYRQPLHKKVVPCLLFLLASLFFTACTSPQLQQFTDVSESSGISFANIITETDEQNIFTYEYMYNGAGVAVGDVNGDGLPDIFFTANQLPDKLYLNKGNLRFEDITDAASVAGKEGWKTGVTMADVNGDGKLDIYVCYSGKGTPEERSNELFINQGVKNGVPFFEEQAKQYGLDASGTNSTQAIFFDYDRDGDLDMFLLNHATQFYSPLFNTYKLRHKRHPWFSNYLFRNDNGHFTDVSAQSGIAGGGNNFGLGVVASDINNDDWPDLYMTNDYEEQDFLLLNNRDGTFKEVTKEALKHISKYGMGCDVADYNNDGHMDIMVPDMWPEDAYRQKVLRGPDEYDKYQILVDSGYMHQNMRNTLQVANGVSTNDVPQFSEIGQLAGVSNTDWSWASLFADLDNDGAKDLYITNGFWRDYSNMDFQTYQVQAYKESVGFAASLKPLVDSIPQTKLSNYAFRNKGDNRFQNVTNDWGLHTANVSNGVAYADLDNDGDLDLVVNNMGEGASVYRNNNLGGGHFLNIQLKGIGGNTAAIGSRVDIVTGNGIHQTLEEQPVRGYLSSVSNILHFGLGKDSVVSSVIVRWPKGDYTTLKNVKGNRTIVVNEASSAKDSKINEPPQAESTFEDITKTAGIDFFQPENEYVDFKHESLLPWQLSRQGPKLSKGDANGDGLDDIFIGAPKGGKGCLYLQQKDGRFKKASSQPWQKDTACDQVQSMFFDADGDKDLDLYIAKGGNEAEDENAYQDKLYLNNGNGEFSVAEQALPPMPSSKCCVAVVDYNGDGRMDIFVGGRLVPGKYGVVPQSYLLQNETGNGVVKFVNATPSFAPDLQYTGMITSALWTDLNHDKLPDLILAGEWMPVKVFVNKGKALADQTKEYGLQGTNGLWTCIVPMDIDNDGDEDFLLGNLAPNTQFTATAEKPMSLSVNDFLHTGKTQCILSYYTGDKAYPYPSRNELLEEFPSFKKKFYYYKNYATASFNDVFTLEQQKGMSQLTANELKNCWLENKGSQMVLRQLPIVAQFSTIQGAVQLDVDGDGTNEIFAAGNFYPFRVQLGREDAGKGVLLQWDAKKKVLTSSPLPLGVTVDGDVRDVKAINTNAGEQLLVIAKNNEPVQVIKTNYFKR